MSDPTARFTPSGAPRSDAAMPPGHLLVKCLLRLLRGLSLLPLSVLRPLGGGLGTLVWWLAVPRRRVTLINLRLCFPHWSDRECARVGREHFQWFTRSILERFIMWFGAPERIRRLVTIENESVFHEYLGRPMIILAPHFVGLDAGATRLSMESEFVAIYQRQKNPVLDAMMLAGRKRFSDGVVLSRQQGVRSAVKLIRKGLPCYYLPDLDLGPRDAIFIPFFGVPAATVTATARLAAMTGAVVLPFVIHMTRNGYVGRFYEPWQDFPGDDIEAATRRMNAFIEDRVREAPAQYLWSHKRFKTRPPGEPSFYAD